MSEHYSLRWLFDLNAASAKFKALYNLKQAILQAI